MKLQRLLNQWPPCLCRLLARHNSEAITSHVLAAVAGLHRDRVDDISKLPSWDSVWVGDALRFMAACGVDPLNARRHREFIKRNEWRHLTRSRKHKFYARLMKIWIETLV